MSAPRTIDLKWTLFDVSNLSSITHRLPHLRLETKEWFVNVVFFQWQQSRWAFPRAGLVACFTLFFLRCERLTYTPFTYAAATLLTHLYILTDWEPVIHPAERQKMSSKPVLAPVQFISLNSPQDRWEHKRPRAVPSAVPNGSASGVSRLEGAHARWHQSSFMSWAVSCNHGKFFRTASFFGLYGELIILLISWGKLRCLSFATPTGWIIRL